MFVNAQTSACNTRIVCASNFLRHFDQRSNVWSVPVATVVITNYIFGGNPNSRMAVQMLDAQAVNNNFLPQFSEEF